MTRDDARKVRVAHGVGFYFPENVGGTEIYVAELVAGLSRLSVDGVVVAATDGEQGEYVYEGAPVFRYPSNWAEIPATPGQGRLSRFQELILRMAPDVFHLHSWTSGAGLRHLSQVAELGIPRVVTVHVPSAICLRGTMLLDGDQACDGLILGRRCARCWAMSRGLPRRLASAVSMLPPMDARRSWLAKISRRGATLLSARALVEAHARDLQAMAALSDRIVAPSEWVRSALAANGVPEDEMVLSRQAVAAPLVAREPTRQGACPGGALRIGFVGRLEPYKGVHVLLDAMALIPRDVPLRLLIAGSGTDPSYLDAVAQKARGDGRIERLGPIAHEQVRSFLQGIDVLAVPSHYMETGPLVVLEAFALGIPVMGADLGGIAERIRDGVDGWLLPTEDSRAWAAAMREAALDRSQVARRAEAVRVDRTMDDVASEMDALYRDVLRGRR